MLNVICVNNNDYLGRGGEYVSRLYRGVRRHLSAPHSFHVLTEKDIPEGCPGWWAKLAMFQPARFKGRCLYFDLDTVIVGDLGDLAGYCGAFAGIDDFYQPERLQSGVMAWQAGAADHVWTKWEEAGKPSFSPRGDARWIEFQMLYADRLQTIVPDQIVSFKAHCGDGIPKGARVVCFHGLPRPHALEDIVAHWAG